VEEADGRVVIAGGGVAGLALALAAGRAGRPVVVVERDAAPLADSPEAAFESSRRGAPQAHQSHGFLARLTLVLRQRFPDLLEALQEAGARPLPLTGDLGEPRPGDEDLAILALRRTTLDWVLRRAVLAEPNVELRNNVSVAGLVASDRDGTPHVTGVRLDDDSVLTAATVAACTGRRGDVPAWLAPLGIEIPEAEHDTQFVYLTRWFRKPDGHADELPPRLGGDLGYLKFLAVPCDGGTFSITLAVHRKDAVLRSALADPDRFERACRLLPGPAALLEGPLESIGGVLPMGGLVNRLRTFLTPAGEPLVTGFHAVGDAHTCTNPLYGRGCALGFVQATLLTDALAAHPGDPAAQVIAYETASAREVEPWYHAAVQMDAFRPPKPGDKDAAESPGAVFIRIATEGAGDPVIGRAMLRLFNLLSLPQDLMTDPEVLAAVAPILAQPAPKALPQPEGPTREEVLA
jgi:2-polyprenyl-6-methoxyphenol hydroxylase-like FAD-dependent oxidoreductase